jgi:hypothetical protein
MVVRFWRDGETLYTQMTGQQPLEVAPVSPTRFRVVVVDAQFEFEMEEGESTGAMLYQNGQETHATRLEDDDSEEPDAWTPEDLGDYVGRFYSAEIETFYEVRLEVPEDEDGEDAEPHLVMNQLWMGDRPMTATTEEDTFSAANMRLQFERDRHGTVTGFYVDVTRTRDVKFVRVESGMGR